MLMFRATPNLAFTASWKRTNKREEAGLPPGFFFYFSISAATLQHIKMEQYFSRHMAHDIDS